MRLSTWLIILLLATLCLVVKSEETVEVGGKTVGSKKDGVPIVYVFTVNLRACDKGLPAYIKFSLEQAVLTQYESDVILVSNYKECAKVKSSSDLIDGLIQIDTATISSPRLEKFYNLSGNIFQDDGYGNLWVTSALRFFYLETMMNSMGYKEIMHIEADNLLYGNLNSIVDIFRKGFKGLAATPLNSNKTFMTASVLWIPTAHSMKFFNDYLLAIVENTIFQKAATNHDKGLWLKYLDWLRPYACCKKGGVQQDENGMGLKPFAINEMSLMGYFHELFPDNFNLLPVVPTYGYLKNRHIIDVGAYAPDGKEANGGAGKDMDGIWDPNSWGQFIGGTSSKNGRDKGFTDGSHIAGIAIRIAKCKPHMMCGNETMHALPPTKWQRGDAGSTGEGAAPATASGTSGGALKCYTAPFVKCGDIESEEQTDWVPLWNLHVHSKHTENYISRPCECGGEVPA
jgi:hypothetical protein